MINSLVHLLKVIAQQLSSSIALALSLGSGANLTSLGVEQNFSWNRLLTVMYCKTEFWGEAKLHPAYPSL